MNEEIIPAEDREVLLRLGCTELDLWALSQFAQVFSRTGRLYLARIFVNALRQKKRTFAEVLVVCQTLFDEVWQYGTPDRIADPDDIAPPNVGLKNTCAFMEAYKRLGLPNPKFLFS